MKYFFKVFFFLFIIFSHTISSNISQNTNNENIKQYVPLNNLPLEEADDVIQTKKEKQLSEGKNLNFWSNILKVLESMTKYSQQGVVGTVGNTVNKKENLYGQLMAFQFYDNNVLVNQNIHKDFNPELGGYGSYIFINNIFVKEKLETIDFFIVLNFNGNKFQTTEMPRFFVKNTIFINENTLYLEPKEGLHINDFYNLQMMPYAVAYSNPQIQNILIQKSNTLNNENKDFLPFSDQEEDDIINSLQQPKIYVFKYFLKKQNDLNSPGKCLNVYVNTDGYVVKMSIINNLITNYRQHFKYIKNLFVSTLTKNKYFDENSLAHEIKDAVFFNPLWQFRLAAFIHHHEFDNCEGNTLILSALINNNNIIERVRGLNKCCSNKKINLF
jgi:hypothetical protein